MKNTEYLMYKKIIEEHLVDFLPEIDHKSITVYEAMKYSLAAGGKRVRPALLLGACEFSGGDIKGALPYACAIEYIHTYSLIHDDLPSMDDDEYRRGVLTNHKVFGEAMAILAGDGLLSSAFEAMGKDLLMYFDDAGGLKKRVRAMYEIAKGCGCRGMIAGQTSDIEAVNKQFSKELLDYIHVNKTAALIVASVRAGAYMGGADADVLRDLTEYAENLGLAYQIADDLLDNTEQGKMTYPALFGLEKSKMRLEELTSKAVDIMSPYYDNAEFFTSLALELETRII